MKAIAALLCGTVVVSALAELNAFSKPALPTIYPVATIAPDPLHETRNLEASNDGENLGQTGVETPLKPLSTNGLPASAVVLFIVGISCMFLLRRRTIERR